MKKLIALLLALVMIIGLVACGAKEEATVPAATEAAPAATEAAKEAAPEGALPYEGVELSVGLAPLVSADADKAFWDEQLKQFTAETGAKVTVEVNDWSNLQTKYVTNYMSGTPYDILYGWPALLVEFVQAGNMVDLSKYYNEEEIANEYFWDIGKYTDGGVYCVAFAGGAAYRSMVFNMDILNECGITEIPDTWDELLAACATIQEKRPDVYTYLVPLTGNTNCIDSTIEPFILQAGGDYWNEDFSAMAIDTPEWKKAFEMLMRMVDAGYISQDAMGMDREVVDNLFAEGKAAITVTDSAQNKFPGKVDFEWVATTAMHDVVAKTYNGVDCLGVSKGENEEAAVALLKFMNSPEVRDAFNKSIYQSGQLRATDIPSETPVEMEDVFAHPERAWAPPMVSFPGTKDEVFIATMQKIVTGQVSIEEGLKDFQSQMDTLMAE